MENLMICSCLMLVQEKNCIFQDKQIH